jgi:hypothetical protein
MSHLHIEGTRRRQSSCVPCSTSLTLPGVLVLAMTSLALSGLPSSHAQRHISYWRFQSLLLPPVRTWCSTRAPA